MDRPFGGGSFLCKNREFSRYGSATVEPENRGAALPDQDRSEEPALLPAGRGAAQSEPPRRGGAGSSHRAGTPSHLPFRLGGPRPRPARAEKERRRARGSEEGPTARSRQRRRRPASRR